MKPWKRLLILELANNDTPLVNHCTYADVKELGPLLGKTTSPGRYKITDQGQRELARLRAALAIADEVRAICERAS